MSCSSRVVEHSTHSAVIDMSERTEISTSDAPQNDNPYSQGRRVGDHLYVSGFGPVDPGTGEELDGDIEAQTTRVLENVRGVVEEAGGSMDDVVKLTVYLTDLEEYDRMNEAYAAVFSEPFPTRVCVEVSRLPGDVAVEMDAIAYLG